MAMYAWHQRPGIDTLMNEYNEGVNAQFGNVRAVREVSSIANQLGRRRTLCEAYGAGGWDLRFEDMKRIGEWLVVLGVNMIDEHLSFITLRGTRKRDHPQSFSYHEPWWNSYHVNCWPSPVFGCVRFKWAWSPPYRPTISTTFHPSAWRGCCRLPRRNDGVGIGGWAYRYVGGIGNFGTS